MSSIGQKNLKSIRESKVEAYFVKRVSEIGGKTRKIKYIGRKDAPDRVVYFNGCWFSELKRPGKKARSSQEREHDLMRKHGVKIYVISTFEEVDRFIDEICST